MKLKLCYNLSCIRRKDIFVIEAKDKLPAMHERIRKCLFCGGEVQSTALGYAENPYCTKCLPERIERSLKAAGPTSWVTVGDYLVPAKIVQRRPQ